MIGQSSSSSRRLRFLLSESRKDQRSISNRPYVFLHREVNVRDREHASIDETDKRNMHRNQARDGRSIDNPGMDIAFSQFNGLTLN